MIFLTTINDGVRGVAQFFTVLFIFILVLGLTYFTTRLAGGVKKQQMSGLNMKVLETVAIAGGKYLQLISVGGKCFVIAVCKDTVTYLCEVPEDNLDFSASSVAGETFMNILEKFKKDNQVMDDEDNEKKDN